MQIYMILAVFFLQFLVICRGSQLKENNTKQYDAVQLLEDIFNSKLAKSSDQVRNDIVEFKNQIITRNRIIFENIDFPKVRPDGIVTFENDNEVIDDINDGGVKGGQKQKNRRRRRKLRRKLPIPPLPYAAYPEYYGPPVNAGVPIGLGEYRPPRRAQESALNGVIDGLVSIARNDDLLCISRLLCEAAAGRADQRLKGVLENVRQVIHFIPGITTSSGISPTPILAALTVFGRGIFTGLHSDKNRTKCFTSFPFCPQDPQEVIHYLNNYKGGFFRFFGFGNGPQADVTGQYGFQGHSDQNGYQGPSGYGQQQGGYGQQHQGPSGYGYQQGSYGYGPQQESNGYGQQYAPGQYAQPLRNGQQQNSLNQNYGYYQPNSGGNYQGNSPYQPPNQYGLYTNTYQQQPHSFQGSNLYHGYQQNYGNNYPYYRKSDLKGTISNNSIDKGQKQKEASTIQKRIQNQKPKYDNNDFDDYEVVTTWKFPYFNSHSDPNNVRGSRHLRFPDKEKDNVEHNEINRTAKGITFPGIQSNRSYYQFNDNDKHFKLDGPVVDSDKVNHNDDEVETVYVVRGNGDPNHPEVVKVPRGQRLQ